MAPGCPAPHQHGRSPTCSEPPALPLVTAPPLSPARHPPPRHQVTDAAMAVLIDQYCREAGVRNLKKHLEKMYRKAALKLVQVGGVTTHK